MSVLNTLPSGAVLVVAHHRLEDGKTGHGQEELGEGSLDVCLALEADQVGQDECHDHSGQQSKLCNDVEECVTYYLKGYSDAFAHN